MSNYRGHVAGASVFAVAYLALLAFVFAVEIIPQDREIFTGYAFPVMLVGLTVLFGIFPDIDINSKAQNLFYSVFFLTDAWLIWSGNFEEAAYMGLVAMLPVISKHRGWTHSKLAVMAVPLPILVLPAFDNPHDVWVGLPYYGAAVTGYFSHLFFDQLIVRWRKR